jgi:hypothetical protein
MLYQLAANCDRRHRIDFDAITWNIERIFVVFRGVRSIGVIV